MRGQKSPQIALGDPHDTTKPMHDEIAGADPTTDRASGDAETLRHLGDCEEFALLSSVRGAHFSLPLIDKLAMN